MIRFTSFKTNPGETRALLRTRFKRHLRAPRNLLYVPDTDLIADEAMLRLLQGLTIKHDSDIDEARRIYAAARPDGEPSFEELVAKGWLQQSWGRIWAPRDFHLALKNTKELTALQHLIGRRHQQCFNFSKAVKSDPDLSTVVAEIEAGPLELRHLSCLTPTWVAARLWERRDLSLPPSVQLQDWTDRWLLLGAPDMVIWRAWTSQDADAFRAVALDVLQTDAALSDWTSSQGQARHRFALPRGVKDHSKHR